MFVRTSVDASEYRLDSIINVHQEDSASVHPIPVMKSDSWRKIAISNNVGQVKYFLRTLLHALVEERHFALVDGLRFPTSGSL